MTPTGWLKLAVYSLLGIIIAAIGLSFFGTGTSMTGMNMNGMNYNMNMNASSIAPPMQYYQYPVGNYPWQYHRNPMDWYMQKYMFSMPGTWNRNQYYTYRNMPPNQIPGINNNYQIPAAGMTNMQGTQGMNNMQGMY